ncbi:SirB2 family protein [Microbulbifer marinus]|uniref:Uncharacterized membrane protein SirB2 n=1 Tax=Microbulbifer marinus TaxID=658218 RepID=A0A1H3XGB7_9GAMM|nr:SirB2 family protein [Microbulbifer marinus]SDZ98250.1 Uncharacterized membrane protein SirB2 [Microbulbifer marinus]
MDYGQLKLLHVTLALLSFSGFTLRSVGLMAGATWAAGRPAKILPHLIDTALLASALWLLAKLDWVLLSQPWLIAKLVGLLGYILCGMLALRFARNNRQRLLASLGAAACFAYILAAAVTKSALPFL